MSEDMVWYYFARLNLIANYQNKAEFIQNSLTSPTYIKQKDYSWGFFEISDLTMYGSKFFTGLLVKFKPSEEEVVDLESHKIATTNIPDRVVSSVRFFLEPKTGVVAYRKMPKLSARQFMTIFGKLVEEANENMLVNAELQAIDEEHEIFKAIREFDKIEMLKISLHPSNPSNRKPWRNTDERLRSMEVQKYSETYTGANIKIKENTEAYGNIIMAEDGYGVAVIRGKMKDQVAVASTARLPAKEKALTNGDPANILGGLYFKFKEIWDRMTKP